MNLGEALQSAFDLMTLHGLTPNWTFRFDSARRRFGRCSHSRRMITLSRPLTELNDAARVKDTILHEIAHALCGPNEGHGPAWRAKAQSIGANGEARYDSAIVKQPARPWRSVCPKCGPLGTSFRRYRNYVHKFCGAPLDWVANDPK
jgi:predicted SprT family Zn-dependent metalloprotease